MNLKIFKFNKQCTQTLASCIIEKLNEHLEPTPAKLITQTYRMVLQLLVALLEGVQAIIKNSYSVFIAIHTTKLNINESCISESECEDSFSNLHVFVLFSTFQFQQRTDCSDQCEVKRTRNITNERLREASEVCDITICEIK